MPKYLPSFAFVRRTGIYALLTLIFCSLFLFSPPPPDDYCGKYVVVGPNAGFPLNCDSYNYVETARDPQLLYEPTSIRQSRPGYVILANAFGHLMKPVVPILPLAPLIAQDELLGSPYYWGFMLLNFLFLWLGLLLFDRIVDVVSDKKFPELPRYVFAVFLVSNITIKTSVWSAHQQMLAIFAPLLCIYATLAVAMSPKLGLWKIYLISLLGGIGVLSYGTFLILIPMVLLAIAAQRVRTGEFTGRDAVFALVPSAAGFLLPLLAWVASVYSVNGNFYSHEVAAYRQFVWIYDHAMMSLSDLGRQFAAFSSIYWISIYRTVLVFLIALAVLKIYRFGHWVISRKRELPENYVLARNAMVVAFTFFAGFFWLMGYYSERITYTLVPIVLCLIALEFSVLIARGLRRTVTFFYVLSLLAAGYWVYNGVTAYEPYKELSLARPQTVSRTLV